MPYIKVNVDKIKEYQQDVHNIRKKVNTISSNFSNISSRLDSDVKNSSGIRRKLQNIESSLADHKTVLQRTNTFLGNTSLKYTNAEKTLYSKDKASGDAKYTDIDEMAKKIAKNKNLSTDDVREVIISGKYSIEQILAYASGNFSVAGELDSAISKLKITQTTKKAAETIRSRIGTSKFAGFETITSTSSDIIGVGAVAGTLEGVTTFSNFWKTSRFLGKTNVENATIGTTAGNVSSKSAYGDWFGYETTDKDVNAYLGEAHADADWGWGNAGVDAYLGKAEAGWDATFNFMNGSKKREYKNGKWEESDSFEIISIDAEVGVDIEGAGVEGSAEIGNDMLGLEGKAEGSILNAEAKGGFEFGIGEDGIDANIEGNAMISAAEGEAKASFNFLGLDITFKIGGYAGALGAEGEFGINDGKFVTKAGLAALFGVSFGFEIGLNDGGWDNIKNFGKDMLNNAKDVVEDVGDNLKEFGEDVKDFVEDVGDNLKEFGEDVKDFAEDVGDAVGSGLKKAWNWVKSW